MNSEITLSSGLKVLVPRIAVSALLLDLARKNPKPLPPLITVRIGGVETQERNYASPSYAAALAAWEEDRDGQATEIIIRMTARENQINASKDLDAIAAARADLGYLSDEQSDALIWLRYVAMKDNVDVTAVIIAARTGEPSEKGITALADGFRGNG